ncbi:MAG: hypothetical protein JNN17_06960 [Verrucomicrobiaceae bacterium]|nr:hypothetical protein [Verrucomicrobiaceae bacterium]
MKSIKFPLCLLGFGSDPLQQLERIIDWYLVETGRYMVDNDKEDLLEIVYSEAVDSEKFPSDAPECFDEADTETLWVILGQSRCHVTGGTVAKTLQNWRLAEAWIEDEKQRFGVGPFVQIGQDFVWEQIANLRGVGSDRMSCRQFRVLCAVNCAIGTKAEPYMISRDYLRALALGFKSPRGLFGPGDLVTPKGLSFLALRPGMEKFPTVKQLRNDLDFLDKRGLIGRIMASRRRVAFYLPSRCSWEEAKKWLVRRLAKASSTLSRRRFEERLLIERIRAGQATGNEKLGKAPKSHASQVD